jgi:N-methylhydantoinase A
LHGSTVAINTVLERSGATTALVTTRGFRDIYEIGRVNRPDAYNLFFRKHRPLVPRSRRFEVDERMTATGEVLRPLEDTELAQIAAALEPLEVEAIAILFLHSYRNPSHEQRAKGFFERRFPRAFVSVSHELSAEYREFERTSTVAANAYIGPRVRRYVGEMDAFLAAQAFRGQFLVVQSTGGLYDSAQAQSECIRMLESGPAAGVIGTQALCRAAGLSRAIAFDMGGTTAKAGVILDGAPLMVSSAMIGGYNEGLPIQIPMLDIQEVGTGGGSIARLAAGNAIRVGPQSAGASPGPVCYGLGGAEPTVTDANLVLGRLSAPRFLGGTMPLDAPRAIDAIASRIARPLGLSLEQAAEGIIRIATASMANVVKRVTTERGLDARDFPLVAYGGAGPLHATLVARELRIGDVVIPNAPGHFSAFGMLLADLRRDYVRTLFARLADAPFELFDRVYAQMRAAGEASVHAAAPQLSAVRTVYGADMRYVGQEHAVSLDIAAELFARRDVSGIKAAFDATHQQRYGFTSPTEPVEIVSLRLSVIGVMNKPVLPRIATSPTESPAAAVTERRPVYFGGHGALDTTVYERAKLLARQRIEGPALVEEHASTTVVLPGDRLRVDDFGNLVIQIGQA